MRICFIVDARSPIAQNWIRYFIDQGHQIHVISTYPYHADSLSVDSFHVIPLAFSGLSRIQSFGTPSSTARLSFVASLLTRLRSGSLSHMLWAAKNWLAPLDVYRHIKDIRNLVEGIQPDLVHAMRLPYEGILAGLAVQEVPLLISVWGNDFTLHAERYPLIGALTYKALQRADALHCDCHHDMHIAGSWGFEYTKPATVLAAAGGVQLTIFNPGPPSNLAMNLVGVAPHTPIVINPRGFRKYVRNDTFFRSIPIVLKQRPDVVFLCSGMQNNPVAERWIQKYRIGHSVKLLPFVQNVEMAGIFRLAQVTVSPSSHDGTPNTLLEAMACGCFPVAGDIASIREWITDEVNGLLCDPADPESIAQSILRALNDSDLRERSLKYNLKLVAEKAEYSKTMARAEQFYNQVIKYALAR